MTAVFPHLPAEAWERFVADELSESAAARLETHLAGCGPCRAALERADPSRIFRRLSALEVRDDQWTGFWEGISSEIAPAGQASGAVADASAPAAPSGAGQPRRGWLRVVVGGLAAAVLAFAAAILVGNGDRRHDDGRPNVAATVHAPGDGAPCPEDLARLGLTAKECAKLRLPIHPAGPPEVIYSSGLDLRDL